MMIGSAFAPGHITGFFEIRDQNKDLRKSGSRGSGLCLSKGVFSTAKCETAKWQKIIVQANGKPVEGAVVKRAVQNLIGDAKFRIEIDEKIELPISQGFGMSAAGALSSAFAVASALEIEKSYWEIVQAAHFADIQSKGGLGDVVCAATGGIDIRRKEGLPPFGFIDRIAVPSEMPVTVAVLGGELETKSVLTNPEKRKAICKSGSKCMLEICREPTWQKFMELSRRFAFETGLASPQLQEAIDALWDSGIPASMSMLGNSIFAFGKKSAVQKAIKSDYVEELRIDFSGARIL